MHFNRYMLINITLTNACFIFSIILIGVQRLISSLISKSLIYTPNNFSRCTTVTILLKLIKTFYTSNNFSRCTTGGSDLSAQRKFYTPNNFSRCTTSNFIRGFLRYIPNGIELAGSKDVNSPKYFFL